MAKLIAIDFGLHRIGIAIADDMLGVATPYKTIENPGKLEQAVKVLLSCLSLIPETITTIVVGLPLLMNGKDSQMTKTVREFSEILKQFCDKDIVLFDERLTSLHIDKMLASANVKRKKRNKITDPLAATLILQNYLDSKQSLEGENL